MTASLVALVVAWSGVWLLTRWVGPTLDSPGRSFAWWTAWKLLVWLGGGAWLLGPSTRRSWLGRWRGGAGPVALLGVAWVAVDALLVGVGVKPAGVWPDGVWPVVNVLCVAPLFEEALFRGLVWTRLEEAGWGPVFIAGVSACGFTLLHVPGWWAMQGLSAGMVVQAASVFLVGLLCGAGRALTGSVWAAAALHLLNNAASLGAFSLSGTAFDGRG